MAKPGKRLTKAYEGLSPDAPPLNIDEAVKQIKSRASAKFDETVEIAMNLNLDPRKPDQNLRGTVMLPHGTGKSVRVGVFARGDRAKEAEAAGADVVGAEDLVEKIQAGEINFDRAIATPDMMALVGRLGRILGPRGLMPNPRLGTVTQNIVEAVRAAKGGQVEFRANMDGKAKKTIAVVHAGVGKASFTDDALVDNVRAFVGAITRGKPSGAKGTYIKGVSLSSTMGPAVKVDLAGLADDTAVRA
jgi:large subunit ribosomal protein L1